MSWVAVGTTAFSAISGSIGAGKAAKKRAQAVGEGIRTIDDGFGRAEELLDPRHQQEMDAMTRVNALLGLSEDEVDFDLFRNTPGYQFMVDEALRGTERSAAARGGLLSGNTLLEVGERTQGIADSTFNQYLSRLMGLQSQGTDYALGNLATERSTNIADLLTGQGEARASGVEGQFGALAGGAAGISDLLGERNSRNALIETFGKIEPKFDPSRNTRVGPSGW